MRHLLFTVSLTLLLFASCRPGIMQRLDDAEALMDARPDSALLILEGIDRSDLKGKESQARFALLKSMALDKNYIDICSDSLIAKAVHYYADHGPKRQKMQAWYYQGVVLSNGGNFPAAVVSLEKAEREASDLRDYYFLGMIYRKQSTVFNGLANGPAAIECREKAIDAFRRAGKDLHASFSLMSLGIDWFNCAEYEKSREVLLDAMSACDHPSIQYGCRLRLAAIEVEQGKDPEGAIAAFRTIPKRFFDLYDYGYYAIAFDRIGDRDSSDFWITRGYGAARSQADSASLDFMRSRIEAGRSNYRQAFALLDNAAKVQESYTRTVMQESLNTALKDYYKESFLREESKAAHTHNMRLLEGILGCFILISLSLFFIRRLKAKNQSLELQMARFMAIQQENRGIRQEIAELIGDLLGERIRHLDQISAEFFSADEKKQKEIVFDSYKKYLDEFRNDKTVFLSLENDLNRHFDGIMDKLKAQVPRISGEKRKITALFFSGVPYETIQLIMKSVSIESLRTLRARIKKEIKDAGAPDADLFLAMLETKKSGRKAKKQNESG